MRRRKRVTYRPSKADGVLGGVVGIVFVILGVVYAIPLFGMFGLIWTFAALGIAGVSLYRAFGGKYGSPQIEIEDEGEEPPTVPLRTEDPQERLEQLRSLYDQRLITQEEYEEKRKEILKEL